MVKLGALGRETPPRVACPDGPTGGPGSSQDLPDGSWPSWNGDVGLLDHHRSPQCLQKKVGPGPAELPRGRRYTAHHLPHAKRWHLEPPAGIHSSHRTVNTASLESEIDGRCEWMRPRRAGRAGSQPDPTTAAAGCQGTPGTRASGVRTEPGGSSRATAGDWLCGPLCALGEPQCAG